MKATIHDILTLMSGWSESDFANAASGGGGEDLLNAIVGACSRANDDLMELEGYCYGLEGRGDGYPRPANIQKIFDPAINALSAPRIEAAKRAIENELDRQGVAYGGICIDKLARCALSSAGGGA